MIDEKFILMVMNWITTATNCGLKASATLGKNLKASPGVWVIVLTLVFVVFGLGSLNALLCSRLWAAEDRMTHMVSNSADPGSSAGFDNKLMSAVECDTVSSY